ncbi:hypothetical protein IWW55_006950, partial [Coemansia sp. RSA 2706]
MSSLRGRSAAAIRTARSPLATDSLAGSETARHVEIRQLGQKRSRFQRLATLIGPGGGGRRNCTQAPVVRAA